MYQLELSSSLQEIYSISMGFCCIGINAACENHIEDLRARSLLRTHGFPSQVEQSNFNNTKTAMA
jgi:hypothetical protein